MRALATIYAVDYLYAEDTRVTQKLLQMYGIKKTLFAYHDHNANIQIPNIIQQIQAGNTVGLVSDAGTPLINDPGFKLVKEAIKHSLPFTSVPGPSAFTNALVLSGLSTNQFQFCGFVPAKSSERKAFYTALLKYPHTLIFYETGNRLVQSLKDLKVVMGDRQIAIAREMTKIFEEILRGTIDDCLKKLKELRGEFVLVVEGATERKAATHEEVMQSLADLLHEKPLKIAARIVADTFDYPRQEAYEMGLRLKNKK